MLHSYPSSEAMGIRNVQTMLETAVTGLELVNFNRKINDFLLIGKPNQGKNGFKNKA